MVKPLGPPPDERENWERMNDGQKRYAMEQYSLAEVRRGKKFNPPGPAQIHSNVQVQPPYSAAHRQAIDDFDLDMFDSDSEGEPDLPNTQENNAADDFINQLSMSKHAPMEGVVSSSSGAKRKATESLGADAGGSHPGTGSNTDGMGSSGGVMPIFSTPGFKRQNYKFHFSKQFKFLSYGVANTILSCGSTSQFWGMTTALANIPWEYAYCYMTPAEFSRVQQFPGARAVKASCTITTFNPRVAFNTGNTDSGLATLNQNKFILKAVGLRTNDCIPLSNDALYTFSATEPMLPASVNLNQEIVENQSMKTNMYGYDNNSPSFDTVSPVFVTGGELSLANYYTPLIPKYAEDPQNYGWPCINDHIHECDAMNYVGKPIIHEEYSFAYAPLTAPYKTFPNDADTVAASVASGDKVNQNRDKTYTPGVGNLITVNEVQNPLVQTTSANAIYASNATNYRYTDSMLEQQGIFAHADSKDTGYKNQPSIHIGVRAVPQLTTADTSNIPQHWLDTQLMYYATFHLEVEASDPFVMTKLQPYERQHNIELTAQNGTNTYVVTKNVSQWGGNYVKQTI